jgi:hypothetical protein
MKQKKEKKKKKKKKQKEEKKKVKIQTKTSFHRNIERHHWWNGNRGIEQRDHNH